MKNIAKLTSYGCYLDCDFVTAKYPGDETHIVGNVAEYVYDLEQKISDLEAKLAESESKVKGFVELFDKKQHENYEQFCEIQQLKQQLEEYKQSLKKTIDHYEKYCSEIHHQNIMLYAAACNAQQASQDKISFAVEQLEDLQDRIENKVNEYLYTHNMDNYDEFVTHQGMYRCFEIMAETIDNQIKAIKGDEVV